MELKIETYGNHLFEVEVKTEHGSLKEELTVIKEGKFKVPEKLITDFIEVANQGSRLNGNSNIEFVKNIFDNILKDSEKQDFIKLIQN